MNEAETRAEHIDPALKVASWGVVYRNTKLAVRFGGDTVWLTKNLR